MLIGQSHYGLISAPEAPSSGLTRTDCRHNLFNINSSETLTTNSTRRTFKMGLINAKNNVPQHQRFYQQAYKAHTRLWMINARSRWYMTPYLIVLWGTLGATFWAAGRKINGHNTWFGKD